MQETDHAPGFESTGHKEEALWLRRTPLVVVQAGGLNRVKAQSLVLLY